MSLQTRQLVNTRVGGSDPQSYASRGGIHFIWQKQRRSKLAQGLAMAARFFHHQTNKTARSISENEAEVRIIPVFFSHVTRAAAHVHVSVAYNVRTMGENDPN